MYTDRGLTENGVLPSGNTFAVVGQTRALPDADQGWSGPSSVSNKQVSTMDTEAKYMG